ncbi:MAG TPA: phosphatase PAP2 family protein [Gemmatimonadota bacterium]|nr:phosphatase PAP2 family protein [Gemmatimonadota bacterium]
MSAAARADIVGPVDWLLAGYNALLSAVWAVVFAIGDPPSSLPALGFEIEPRHALLLALAHAGAVGLPWAIARLPARPRLPVRLLREAYPLLFVPLGWLELDPLIRTLHVDTWDGVIMALDRLVFGIHLDRVWIRAMPQRWFSELMYFSYWVYLPLIFLPPVAMALRRNPDGFRDVTLRLLATYLGCFVVYILMPTAGPKVFGLPFHASASGGTFFGLVTRAHETGNVFGAAFPSSHVAGAVTVAWLGWRWFGRGVAALLTIQALGVVMSTVYTQNHYAIDSLVGVAFALAIQARLVPTLERLGRRAPAPYPRPSITPPVPVTPLPTPPLPMPPRAAPAIMDGVS